MEKPNIIVIMADQFKATASHLYGNSSCITPSMERLANEGVLFKHAFTPHPLCVPARISLWTSRYPHANGKRTNESLMNEDAFHAFKEWKEMGYHTGLIGKNHCFGEKDHDNVFDTWCEISHMGLKGAFPLKGMNWVEDENEIDVCHTTRCNMVYKTPIITYAFTDYPEDHYSTGLIANQTIKFLDEKKEEPFALWVSFPDPHTPLEVPRRYAELFNNKSMEIPPWPENEYKNAPERNKVLYEMIGIDNDPEEEIYNAMAAYYGMVRFVDDSIGRIIDTLDRLGLRENTIVVVCSDHGDFMGEHRMIDKGGAFYDCLTRVPLIVSWPGKVPEGCVDESMVSLIDIVPTIFKLQNIDIPSSMQGAPLPTATSESPRDAAYSEYGAGGEFFTLKELAKMPVQHGEKPFFKSLIIREAEGRRKMIRTKKWKYVFDPMGDMDELYDMVSDPWETNNVVQIHENKSIVNEMKARLLNWSIMTEGI